MAQRVSHVVLTGGPRSGKTTGKVVLRERLTQYGCHVLTPPEVATKFFETGVPRNELGVSNEKFQRELLLNTITEEAQYRAIADAIDHDHVVILYDRGRADGEAYMESPKHFKQVYTDLGFTEAQIKDEPYDGVIHLVTTAFGVEDAYSNENNPHRYENPEEARITDRKTLAAWQGTEHLIEIDNSTDFAGKMLRARQALARIIGIPEPIEDEKVFWVTNDPEEASRVHMRLPPHAAPVEIEQTYLHPGPHEGTLRVRRRTLGDGSVYYRTAKRDLGEGKRVEYSRQINHETYGELLNLALPDMRVITKTRYCFTHETQYIELDVYHDDLTGLVTLEIERTEDVDVHLPPGFEHAIDVTGRSGFSNFSYAQHGKPEIPLAA